MKKILNSLFVLSAVVLIISLGAGGCDRPTAELKRAEAAINDAKRAGASDLAAAELASAEQALSQGKSQMNNWQYKKARESFEEAYRLALKAKEIALAAGRDVPVDGTYVPPPSGPSSRQTHTVVKGECLWWISEYKDVYGDPFQWPLIYDANRSEIDSTANAHGFNQHEEDWIFPGQQFDVPQDASVDQIKNARRRAGAPAPYLPPGN